MYHHHHKVLLQKDHNFWLYNIFTLFQTFNVKVCNNVILLGYEWRENVFFRQRFLHLTFLRFVGGFINVHYVLCILVQNIQ